MYYAIPGYNSKESNKEEIELKHNILTGFATAAMLSSVSVPAMNQLFAKPAIHHTAEAATVSEQEFINRAARVAQKAGKRYGIYPSVMIAQAILESDWGHSGLAVQANNLFGIKASNGWNGLSVTLRTREENAKGKSYYITAAFKKYNTLQDSFNDNGSKLRFGVTWQPLRYSGAWLENASTPAAATKALTGTYATDHHYNVSLDKRISAYNLRKYDPKISNQAKSYRVAKNAVTYVWPTDHNLSAKQGRVKKGRTVNVDKTITYYNGSKRLHISGQGWVNGDVLKTKSALPATQIKGKRVVKYLMHRAYVYDYKGRRLKRYGVLKEDSVINTYGTKRIKGRLFYHIGVNRYVAAGNINATLRMLKHNAYVYNGSGNRDNHRLYKKNSALGTYGNPVRIMHQKFYKIGVHQYVKVANFAN